jgi:hypothetical protein
MTREEFKREVKVRRVWLRLVVAIGLWWCLTGQPCPTAPRRLG